MCKAFSLRKVGRLLKMKSTEGEKDEEMQKIQQDFVTEKSRLKKFEELGCYLSWKKHCAEHNLGFVLLSPKYLSPNSDDKMENNIGSDGGVLFRGCRDI